MSRFLKNIKLMHLKVAKTLNPLFTSVLSENPPHSKFDFYKKERYGEIQNTTKIFKKGGVNKKI